LAVIALPCLLYSMDLTVLFLAVPHLSADLQPSSTQLLWITDIYGFLLAGLLITMGTLGDRIGRRRLLLLGAALFGLASLLAAYATSPGLLIAARALLGVAGATLAPSTLSLLRNMFHDHRQRTVAIAVWITSFSAGAAIGPLLGGVLLERFWWGSVFLLAVPVMLLLLVLGPMLLPEYRDPDAGRLDLGSAALSLTAVLAVIYGLKQLAQDGLSCHLEEVRDGTHRQHRGGRSRLQDTGARSWRCGNPRGRPGQRPPAGAAHCRDPRHRALEPARDTVADLERGDEPRDGLPDGAVGLDHRAGAAGRRDRLRCADHHSTTRSSSWCWR